MSLIKTVTGDCLRVMKTMLPDASVDAIVTDPPYGLSNHTTEETIACLTAWVAGEPYVPKGKGFMGREWDAWVPGPEIFKEAYRVLKPGGHILAFAGTRSMDLMSMAIRLAGFELRDSIGWAHEGHGAPLLAWTYGSGFPKSHSVSVAIDKTLGAMGHRGEAFNTAGLGAGFTEIGGNMEAHVGITPEAQKWQGWGTALKPAWEPIILARKPLIGTVAANVLAHGTGALNIDGCRVVAEGETITNHSRGSESSESKGIYGNSSVQDIHQTPGQQLGRWPANLIHDGSAEVVGLFPDTGKSTGGRIGKKSQSTVANTPHGNFIAGDPGYGDSGSAARFFYTAKASKHDRDEGLEEWVEQRTGGMKATEDGSMLTGAGNERITSRKNTHPTVKPTELMRYLCRLVTPPGGLVLDPFMGSGSTGKAAVLEGFGFYGIDLDPEYRRIAEARIAYAKTLREQEMSELPVPRPRKPRKPKAVDPVDLTPATEETSSV